MNDIDIVKDDECWDTVITSDKKLLDLRLKDVWNYRYLIKMFIKRDFVVAYKQTILGPVWYLVQPVVTAIMNTFVFGKMARLGTDGIPYMLFYFSGTMLWTYFTACLNSCAGTFVTNQNIFGKVYFPRLVTPVASCLFHMFKLAIQFLLLICFFVFYIAKGFCLHISAFSCLFPLIIVWIGFIGMGFGLVISSLTTKYRDLNILLVFGLQLAMYATPVVYPLSQIPNKFIWLAYINPMSSPIELFRIIFYGAGRVEPLMCVSSLIITFIVLFFGLVLFVKNERNFVDVI